MILWWWKQPLAQSPPLPGFFFMCHSLAAFVTVQHCYSQFLEIYGFFTAVIIIFHFCLWAKNTSLDQYNVFFCFFLLFSVRWFACPSGAQTVAPDYTLSMKSSRRSVLINQPTQFTNPEAVLVSEKLTRAFCDASLKTVKSILPLMCILWQYQCFTEIIL